MLANESYDSSHLVNTINDIVSIEWSVGEEKLLDKVRVVDSRLS